MVVFHETSHYSSGVSYHAILYKILLYSQCLQIRDNQSVESAFARYKEYKEDFIKKIARQNREWIPNKVYEAMMGWEIEVDD